MTVLRLRRSPLRWGNGYGIRLTKAEMKELGAGEEEQLEVEVRPGAPPLDFSKLHITRGGPRNASVDHDRLAAGGYYVRR